MVVTQSAYMGKGKGEKAKKDSERQINARTALKNVRDGNEMHFCFSQFCAVSFSKWPKILYFEDHCTATPLYHP
ncbi:hypothetical protein POVWA2_026920 [Plasmodium ovale wallikeri]|uniref:Uncharacterized protein n=1 Tax=Plasmodium ovale wallikeri TaxID=864142 RepID=A0A1A8YV00_PLAOA|nr:hypothetical protein POVWA1_026950 [Plasmodium ovale wallikeri]SBT35814.1 hypothetical protein POVWA2_026920 [Plasmodium ovale wallikeri]